MISRTGFAIALDAQAIAILFNFVKHSLKAIRPDPQDVIRWARDRVGDVPASVREFLDEH